MGSVGEEVPMTRLDEIRARLGQATPGPWLQGNGFVLASNAKVVASLINCDGPKLDNAAFVAHAPADIAWLVGEVERLREAHRALLAAAEGVLADAVEEMAGEEGVA